MSRQSSRLRPLPLASSCLSHPQIGASIEIFELLMPLAAYSGTLPLILNPPGSYGKSRSSR